MSWLLFLDESGHDLRSMPYEVRGGFAVHASRLWPLIQSVQKLELATFGCALHEFGSELKGSKLLAKDRFKWSAQGPPFDELLRRKHAFNFLKANTQLRSPRRFEFTAYGQACLAAAEGALALLEKHEARVFAAIIPCIQRVAGVPENFLRKDHVFLFERYFYFLEAQRDTGLIVMDGSDKSADRVFVRRIERYFTQTIVGKQRTAWIVPSPLFVDSEMAYGVQVADLCVYCLNLAYRIKDMTEPTRTEIEPFARLVDRLIWRGDGYREGNSFKTQGVVHVPDPYAGRDEQKRRR